MAFSTPAFAAAAPRVGGAYTGLARTSARVCTARSAPAAARRVVAAPPSTVTTTPTAKMFDWKKRADENYAVGTCAQGGARLGAGCVWRAAEGAGGEVAGCAGRRIFIVVGFDALLAIGAMGRVVAWVCVRRGTVVLVVRGNVCGGACEPVLRWGREARSLGLQRRCGALFV